VAAAFGSRKVASLVAANSVVQTRSFNMMRWHAVLALSLVTGCADQQTVATPTVVGERTVTVSGDDPFISMEDGTKLPVDGVVPGQSIQLRLVKYRDSNGKLLIGVESSTNLM
jgi:hypothetical protein